MEAEDEYGATALVLATYGGHIDIVKELLDAGAEIHAKDRNGLTAAAWAVSRRYDDVVDF
ncbi:MAG: ankyrin repeat domain-containing protein [Desulfomonilaceae bacterium]